jgi:hypothetical protein
MDLKVQLQDRSAQNKDFAPIFSFVGISLTQMAGKSLTIFFLLE